MLGRIIKKVALMTDAAASASKSGVVDVWICLDYDVALQSERPVRGEMTA